MADVLTIKDLKRVRECLYDIRAKWYDIGVELDVPVGTLDSIKSSSHSPEECLREMLKAWLSSLTSTPQMLAAALRAKAVGEPKLAEQVELELKLPQEVSDGPATKKLKMASVSDVISLLHCMYKSEDPVEKISGKFPFLETKHLSKEERLRLEGRLGLESEKLQDKFANLISDTAQALQENQVDIEQLKVFLTGYDVPVNTSDNSVTRVMLTARKSWHFLSYRILKNVIHKFGSKENQRELMTYDSEFRSYCRRRLCEVPIDMLLQGSKEEITTRVCIKTDKYFDFPLEDFHILENRISEILDTQVILIDVDRGCVKLVYNCLKASDELFPLSTYQEEQLRREGVVMLYSTHYEHYLSLNLDLHPSPSRLHLLLKDISYCWCELGRCLKITPSDLDLFRNLYSSDSQCMMKVFEHWHNPTWSDIIKSLRKLKFNSLAEKIYHYVFESSRILSFPHLNNTFYRHLEPREDSCYLDPHKILFRVPNLETEQISGLPSVQLFSKMFELVSLPEPSHSDIMHLELFQPPLFHNFTTQLPSNLPAQAAYGTVIETPHMAQLGQSISYLLEKLDMIEEEVSYNSDLNVTDCRISLQTCKEMFDNSAKVGQHSAMDEERVQFIEILWHKIKNISDSLTRISKAMSSYPY